MTSPVFLGDIRWKIVWINIFLLLKTAGSYLLRFVRFYRPINAISYFFLYPCPDMSLRQTCYISGTGWGSENLIWYSETRENFGLGQVGLHFYVHIVFRVKFPLENARFVWFWLRCDVSCKRYTFIEIMGKILPGILFTSFFHQNIVKRLKFLIFKNFGKFDDVIMT